MPRFITVVAVVCALVGAAVQAHAQDSVYVEELTWVEVRDAVKAGKTTVIIPTGGTEQNGPHAVLGKHNFIVAYAAGEIAKRLGNALVAPALAYVPEGDVNPPSGAMRYAGGITLPEDVFIQVLVWASRSFKVHGFTDIVLIGDSGGNQPGLKAAAAQLNKEWAGTNTRAHFVDAYYLAISSGQKPLGAFDAWLVSQGENLTDIGSHAGIKDTSTLMAVEAAQTGRRGAQYLRKDKLAPNGGFEGSGVRGNPARASVEYGRKGLEFSFEMAVRQIRAASARQ